MDVRPAETHTDVRSAIEINRSAWRAAYADILPESTLPAPDAPLSEESVHGRFDDIANRDEMVVLVARGPTDITGADDDVDCDDVCGFVEFVWGSGTKEFVPDDAVELRGIYVDPDCWGNGVGTALLDAAIDHLPPEKQSLVHETFTENDVGRRFYEARGFEAVDDHAVDVDGESHPTVIYRKQL